MLYEESAAGLIEALEPDEEEEKHISYVLVWGAYHSTAGGREPTGPEPSGTPALLLLLRAASTAPTRAKLGTPVSNGIFLQGSHGPGTHGVMSAQITLIVTVSTVALFCQLTT